MIRQFTYKELKRIIDLLFDHFERPWILKREFKPYLEAKGYSEEEIEEIWGRAFNKGLLLLLSTPIDGDFELTIVKPESEETTEEELHEEE